MLVGDIVRLQALIRPNSIGIIDEQGSRLTWQQFNGRVNRLANALLALGLEKGDRVAMMADNSHQYGEFFFATAKSGLVYVGLNYRQKERQLLAVINDADPRAIIIQDKYKELIESIRPELSGVRYFIGLGEGHGFPYDYESLITESSPYEPEPKVEIKPDDMHILMYSSGTTGEPKGVPFSHKRWISGLLIQPFVAIRYVTDDVTLLGLPLYAGAATTQFLGACTAGIAIVLYNFSGRGFAELVEREKVTITYLNSTLFHIVRDCLDSSQRKYDFSSLRSLRVGARPMPANQLKEMLDYFNIPYHCTHRVYSSVEVSPTQTILTGEEIASGLSPNATDKEKMIADSAGKPFLTEIRVVDENGQDVPPGKVGEIIWKLGDSTMPVTGYWNKPELSRQVIKDGWYHTRDLGTFDEDGYLYFRGRMDFMIKSGMFFVAPVEVENAILQHPLVSEVAVIGVPDEKWGEAVTAIVSLKKGQSASAEEIKEHCREYLMGYQVPKSVKFIERLPKDGQGKIDVKSLRKAYAEPAEKTKRK